MKKNSFIFLTALFAVALIGFSNVKMDMSVSKNASLLTLDKAEALGWAEFIIKQNGSVGIYNEYPSYALEIGSSAQSPTAASEIEIPAAALYQNSPNPWTETTEIRYELPEGAKDAAIYIFDLSGKLLKTLTATSAGSVTLKGSELKAGLYFYSLVVDGQKIDTKQMILTK